MALDGHFVSGLMRDFTGCHFGYISESVVVASEAAGLIITRVRQQLQDEHQRAGNVHTGYHTRPQISRLLSRIAPVINGIS